MQARQRSPRKKWHSSAATDASDADDTDDANSSADAAAPAPVLELTAAGDSSRDPRDKPGSPAQGFAARRAAKLANSGMSPRSGHQPASPPLPRRPSGESESPSSSRRSSSSRNRAKITSNWAGEKPRTDLPSPQRQQNLAATSGSPRGGGANGGANGAPPRRLKKRELSGERGLGGAHSSGLTAELDLDALFSTPSEEGCIDAALSRGHGAQVLPLGLVLKRAFPIRKGDLRGGTGDSGSGAVVFALSEQGAAADQGQGWIAAGRPLLEINGADVSALPFDVVVLMVAERWRACCRAAAMEQEERGQEVAAAAAMTAAHDPAEQRGRPTVLRLRLGRRVAKRMPVDAGAVTADCFPVTFGPGSLGLGLCWEAKQAMVPPVVEQVRDGACWARLVGLVCALCAP